MGQRLIRQRKRTREQNKNKTYENIEINKNCKQENRQFEISKTWINEEWYLEHQSIKSIEEKVVGVVLNN